MKLSSILVTLLPCLCLASTACKPGHAEEGHGKHEVEHTIVVTSPVAKSIVATQKFVSQIHSRRHIEVRAMERGFLEEIQVQEGQSVKKGQLLFKLLPVIFKARLHGEEAELQRVAIQLQNTEKLFEQKVVSDQEVALARTEWEKAKANVELATAELAFTEIRAPFDAILDRQYEQEGSLIEEGDMLTTLSDNAVMWVYFNVPEADYLDYRVIPGAVDPANQQLLKLPNTRIELQLANGKVFDQAAGDTVTVESTFDNETGTILFRADFPNPIGLLRHGQTGTLLIHRTVEDAIVIPQRSTFEILDKRYVYVVDADGVAHQRTITVSHEMDDVFVVGSGVEMNDKVVLDGVRQVRDGAHLEFEYRDPEEALQNLKYHAE